MITSETGPDRAARWLAEYLADQPGRMAESSEAKAAAAEQLGVTSRYTLERARARLGVKVRMGSLPGRPFVTWWLLPARQQLTLTNPQRDRAEADVREVARGNLARAQACIESAGSVRVALALAVLLNESRLDPSLNTLRGPEGHEDPTTARGDGLSGHSTTRKETQ